MSSLSLYSAAPMTSAFPTFSTQTKLPTLSANLKKPAITAPVDIIVKSTLSNPNSLANRDGVSPYFLDNCPDVPTIAKELNRNNTIDFMSAASHSNVPYNVNIKTDRVSLEEPCPGFAATQEQTCKAWNAASKAGGNSTEVYSRFNQTLPFKVKFWAACTPPDLPFTSIPGVSTASTCTASLYEQMYKSLTPVNPSSFQCKTIDPNALPSSTVKTSITTTSTVKPPTYTPTANAAPRAGSVFSYASPGIKTFKKGVRALGKASGFRK